MATDIATSTSFTCSNRSFVHIGYNSVITYLGLGLDDTDEVVLNFEGILGNEAKMEPFCISLNHDPHFDCEKEIYYADDQEPAHPITVDDTNLLIRIKSFDDNTVNFSLSIADDTKEVSNKNEC